MSFWAHTPGPLKDKLQLPEGMEVFCEWSQISLSFHIWLKNSMPHKIRICFCFLLLLANVTNFQVWPHPSLWCYFRQLNQPRTQSTHFWISLAKLQPLPDSTMTTNWEITPQVRSDPELSQKMMGLHCRFKDNSRVTLPNKLTWQQKIHYLKMHFALNMGIFPMSCWFGVYRVHFKNDVEVLSGFLTLRASAPLTEKLPPPESSEHDWLEHHQFQLGDTSTHSCLVQVFHWQLTC